MIARLLGHPGIGESPKANQVASRKLAGLLAGALLVIGLAACGTASQATAPVPTATSGSTPATVVLPTAPTAPGHVATTGPTATSAEVGPLPDVPLEQGDRTRGERLFSSVGCIGCHTVKGVGGNVGPDLSAVASRAPQRAAVQGLSRPELYFVQSVVYPKAFVVEGFTPVMPNWKALQVNEKDLADLAAYLNTLKGE